MIQKICAGLPGRKTKSRKGFTLAELLIVVAIIGVLVAIAIPVFSSQLTKAREEVDKANLRSATSLAVTDYVLAHPDGTGSETTYHAFVKTEGNTSNMQVSTSGTLDGYTELTSQVGSKKAHIVIGAGGEVITSEWAS